MPISGVCIRGEISIFVIWILIVVLLGIGVIKGRRNVLRGYFAVIEDRLGELVFVLSLFI